MDYPQAEKLLSDLNGAAIDPPAASFTLSIPEEHEPGYMALIDDAMEISLHLEEGQHAQAYRAMKRILFEHAIRPETEAEKLTLLRSMSLPQFEATFAQIQEALAASKKN